MPLPGEKRTMAIKGDTARAYMVYVNSHDELFGIYPIIK